MCIQNEEKDPMGIYLLIKEFFAAVELLDDSIHAAKKRIKDLELKYLSLCQEDTREEPEDIS